MPPAIEDSEEEEELLLDDDEDKDEPSQPSTIASALDFANQFLSEPLHEGANDRSSLSTDEISRRIADTTRGFFSSKSEGKPTSKTMAPCSSAQKVGRRHTNVNGSQMAATPSKISRRSLTTYGSAKQRVSKAAQDYAAFDALDKIDGASQVSLGANNHSTRLQASLDEIMLDRFQDHNPNALFRDTGSTVPFGDSSEQRMMEMARATTPRPASSGAGPDVTAEEQSSFPWPPSENQSTPLSNCGKHEDRLIDHQPAENTSGQPQDQETANDAREERNDASQAAADGGINKGHASATEKTMPPASSPMVIIPAAETPAPGVGSITEKLTRGRKRRFLQQEECSEPLNSDDGALGLPKELYVPRLSKRRSTAVVEEPVDLSIAPEKAVKKRRKTVGGADTTLASQSQEHGSSRKWQNGVGASSVAKPVSMSVAPKYDPPADSSFKPTEAADTLRSSPQRPGVDPLSQTTARAQAWPSRVEPLPSGDFGKSSPTQMLPPVLPASATRKTPRRSQTTIFEDHTTQRSPSLRQQQAVRQSSARDIPRPSQRAARARRSIVQVDDEEDELAGISALEKPAPKKRGRSPKAETGKMSMKSQKGDSDEDLVSVKAGRKTKTAADVLFDSDDQDRTAMGAKRDRKTKSRAKVLDSENEDEFEAEVELEDDDDDDEDAESQPRKKGLGCASKKQIHVEPKADSPEHDKRRFTKDTSAQLIDKHVLEPKDANINTKKDGQHSRDQTPAPATDVSGANQAKKPASENRSGPNSHSPIKKNSKVIHRVGLGRRQNVQPLLKMIRPAANRKEERVTKLTSMAELEKKWNARIED